MNNGIFQMSSLQRDYHQTSLLTVAITAIDECWSSSVDNRPLLTGNSNHFRAYYKAIYTKSSHHNQLGVIEMATKQRLRQRNNRYLMLLSRWGCGWSDNPENFSFLCIQLFSHASLWSSTIFLFAPPSAISTRLLVLFLDPNAISGTSLNSFLGRLLM